MYSNLDCEKFNQEITQIINNCHLMPVVAYYILKDRLNELEKICQQVIQQEKQNLNIEHTQEKIYSIQQQNGNFSSEEASK